MLAPVLKEQGKSEDEKAALHGQMTSQCQVIKDDLEILEQFSLSTSESINESLEGFGRRL